MDPWSFVLPLTPLVWTATLIALLVVFAVLQLFSSSLPGSDLGHNGQSASNALSCVRVILQQGEASRTVLLAA